MPQRNGSYIQPSGLTMNITNANLPAVPCFVSGPSSAIPTNAVLPPALPENANVTQITADTGFAPQAMAQNPSLSRMHTRPRYVLPPDLATVEPHTEQSTPFSVAATNELTSVGFVSASPDDTVKPVGYDSQPPAAPGYDVLPSTFASNPPTLRPYEPATSFWFYATNIGGTRIWWPFSRYDSFQLESKMSSSGVSPVELDSKDDLKHVAVPVEGGRYDVSISRRERRAVYWDEPVTEVRRASWFFRPPNENRFLPFSEPICEHLEAQYKLATERDSWDHHFELPSEDPRGGYDRYVFHSPESMVQYRTWSSSVSTDSIDLSQTTTEDILMKLTTTGDDRERNNHLFYVRRGLDEQLRAQLDDGESQPVDHVYFVVHGIGTVYNLKGQGLIECVDALRRTARQIAQRNFPNRNGRAEFLPITWHNSLHSDATGIDEQLSKITLRSIPKLRQFTNSTLMDILFYTSSKYCQVVLDSVAGDLRKLRQLFLSRNPGYTGGFSIIGHSLGSVIVFDLLAHQHIHIEGRSGGKHQATSISNNAPISTVSQSASQYGTNCETVSHTNDDHTLQTSADCDVHHPNSTDSVHTASRDRLTEILSAAGLSQEQLNQVLQSFGEKEIVDTGNSVLEYAFGPASASRDGSGCFTGFGVPKVTYPQLGFDVTAFFMLGSPLGLFLTARGVQHLSQDYRLPTCPMFFNVFHPYDPVASRIESLVEPTFSSPAALIPHHKGRKRFHLQLRDDLARVGSDIKSKIFQSAQATWRTLQDFALSHRFLLPNLGEKTEDGSGLGDDREMMHLLSQCHVDPQDDNNDNVAAEDCSQFSSKLNQGRRLDFVLQEAPLESFSDYLFALSSHATYWDSEDTTLFLLTEIYSRASTPSDSSTNSRVLTSSLDASTNYMTPMATSSNIGLLSGPTSKLPIYCAKPESQTTDFPDHVTARSSAGGCESAVAINDYSKHICPFPRSPSGTLVNPSVDDTAPIFSTMQYSSHGALLATQSPRISLPSSSSPKLGSSEPSTLAKVSEFIS